MRHITAPNPYACLLACVAMVLEVETEELIEEVGHDGRKQRGFHIQEFAQSFLRRGYGYMFMSQVPVIVRTDGEYLPLPGYKLSDYIKYPSKSILLTLTHAVACDGHEIFDPAKNGKVLGLSTAFNTMKFEHLILVHPMGLAFRFLCDTCYSESEPYPVWEDGVKKTHYVCKECGHVSRPS